MGKGVPLFSIIIPVYNVERYLPACLDSVLKQSFTNFEVVCINDGSTDGSLNVLKDYSGKYPSMKIISQKNGGLSAARNTGIKAAEGDYLLFLDSDDWIESNLLEMVIKNIENEDIISFSSRKYYEKDNVMEDDIVIEDDNLTGWGYYNKYVLQTRKIPFECVWQRVYKKEFIINNNILFEEGILHEDNLFTPFAFFYAEKVKVIPYHLHIYRIRAGSITQTISSKSFYNIVFIANKLAKFFIDNNIKSGVVFHNLAYYYPNVLINIKKQNKLDLIDEIYEIIDWESYKKISKGKDKLMFYMVKYKIPLFYNYQSLEKIKKKNWKV